MRRRADPPIASAGNPRAVRPQSFGPAELAGAGPCPRARRQLPEAQQPPNARSAASFLDLSNESGTLPASSSIVAGQMGLMRLGRRPTSNRCLGLGWQWNESIDVGQVETDVWGRE